MEDIIRTDYFSRRPFRPSNEIEHALEHMMCEGLSPQAVRHWQCKARALMTVDHVTAEEWRWRFMIPQKGKRRSASAAKPGQPGDGRKVCLRNEYTEYQYWGKGVSQSGDGPNGRATTSIWAVVAT
jgi:hypothetical protein